MTDRYRVDCRKFPSDQGCTPAISAIYRRSHRVGMLHAKTHQHKDDERTGIKEWIRGNAEAVA